MTQTHDPSPRAQAILRAIENEAKARRERDSPARAVAPVEPLGEAADRLMRLVDHVVLQTEGVRARVREVEESLDILSSKLAEPATIKPAVEIPAPTPEAEPDPVVVIQEPAPASSAPPAEPDTTEPDTTEPAAATPPTDTSDGARLMAIEMAVSGSSRGEVGSRLTEDFHVADPAPILDDVFGAGSPDSTRMPWTN